MSETIQYTQKQIQRLLLPLLKEKGRLYQKSKNVFARSGKKGERIITLTSDGKETENVVKDKTSFVVKNQTTAAEEYIVSGAKFQERYELIRAVDNGYQEYQSKGKVMAVKLTRKLWESLEFPSNQLYFEAPWGSAELLKKHDYMVCPLDYSEVYRIGRREFWETYQLIK